MRVLLVNVPVREDSAPNNFPTGLGMIAAVLRQHQHDVSILDANAHRYGFDEVVSKIVEDDAVVIGISGLVSTYEYQGRLVAAIKEKASKKTVVLGGGCATSVPELLMSHTLADILVIGEGEHTIVELVGVLESGDTLKQVKGIVFRDGEEVIFNEPRPLESDLDVFPMPAYDLFPVEIYLKYPIWNFKEPAMNIISSRGCPMGCHFCYNLFGRRSYRRRGVDAIVEEIRYLRRRYGIGTFGFVDDNVTINRRHLMILCDALEKENITWGCHGRVDTADDERLERMAKAGCKWLGFGIESGSQRILDQMNKKVTVEKARNAILGTRKHGMWANTTFIHGYPGEDLESVKETLRFKLEMGVICDSFFATPYPGTELYAKAREKGFIKDEHEFMMSLNNAYDFTINLTDFSDEELIATKKQAFDELKIALVFKEAEISSEEETTFVNLADKFLNQETLIPETKGIVLLRLADHFEKQGDVKTAFMMKATALRYGVSFDQGPSV